MKHSLLFSVLGLLAFSSCSDKTDTPEQDLVRPTITWVGTLPDSLSGGSNLSLELGLADNAGLSQLKLEIHDNFDNHTHQKGSVLPFSWDSIITLQGINQVVNLSIPIPADIAAGNYDVLVQAIDASGNEALPSVKSLFLKNGIDSEAPEINFPVWDPAPTGGVIILDDPDTDLYMQASISDNLGIDLIELKVIRESDEQVVHDYDEEPTSSSVQFSYAIIFDPAWGAGKYHVELKVKDIKGNTSILETEVEYTP